MNFSLKNPKIMINPQSCCAPNCDLSHINDRPKLSAHFYNALRMYWRYFPYIVIIVDLGHYDSWHNISIGKTKLYRYVKFNSVSVYQGFNSVSVIRYIKCFDISTYRHVKFLI